MSLRRDGFVRCYLEAWAYWVMLNLLSVASKWIVAWVKGDGFNLWSINELGMFTEPLVLLAQGIMLVPLFAAILVGIRRPTGNAT